MASALSSGVILRALLLSRWDERALAATRKNQPHKETTLKELNVYAKLFVEAKCVEIKSC